MGAGLATGATCKERRSIEDLQKRQTQVSLGEEVDRAAVKFGRPFRDLPLSRLVKLIDKLRVDRNHHASAPGLQIEPPRDREHGVAQLFRSKSPAAETPPQPVFRIVLLRLGSAGRIS